tara:strand:- start:30 stop:212 length:183 start_codon:yes stop_codon:yes gene_type:complete
VDQVEAAQQLVVDLVNLVEQVIHLRRLFLKEILGDLALATPLVAVAAVAVALQQVQMLLL